jgi:hypothetical protein
LLVVASEVLPSFALGAGANGNHEVAGFGFPNKEPLDFVLLVSPKAGFAAAIPKGLFPAAALGIEAKSPLYSGFVSALSPLEGIGDGVPEIFPVDEPVVGPNNPPVTSALTVPESVSLVGKPLNAVGFGLVLSGFGEGVLPFRRAGGEGVPLRLSIPI